MRAYRLASRRISNRQCCSPFSRGAMLVIVWSILLNAKNIFGHVIAFVLLYQVTSSLNISLYNIIIHCVCCYQ